MIILLKPIMKIIVRGTAAAGIVIVKLIILLLFRKSTRLSWSYG